MRKIKAIELVGLFDGIKNINCINNSRNVFLTINKNNTVYFDNNLEVVFSDDNNFVTSNGDKLNYRISTLDASICFGINSNIIATFIN